MKPKIIMYSTAVCLFCVRSGQLLDSRRVTHFDPIRGYFDPARREEMMQKTGRRTVPQIYIGEHHVGGCDDLYALDRAGKLESLLRSE